MDDRGKDIIVPGTKALRSQWQSITVQGLLNVLSSHHTPFVGSMPQVSIIVPCYNEEDTIGLLLAAISRQTYLMEDMEVVVADGMSTDRTRQVIVDFQREHPSLRVKLVDNPKRNIPAALNRAIAASQGEIIVRLDAHCVPHQDYVARSVSGLQQQLGDNIGGVWEIQPGGRGWLAESIALAAAHPLAVGDARYRYTAKAQRVETVPFGAFRRDLVERIGGFDETLLSNEDYEFNARLRQNGGVIWLDPAIRSTYFARPTLRALAKQYGRYGYWKLRMLMRSPASLRWRQALPPLFVLSLLLWLVLAIWLPLAGWFLLLEVVLYALVLMTVGLQVALKKRTLRLLIGVPLAIAIMHLFWGGAFLWSLITSLIGR